MKSILLISIISFVTLTIPIDSLIYRDQILVQSKDFTNQPAHEFSPLVQCDFLSSEFYECESVEDIPENDTRSCQKKNDRHFSGEKYEDVTRTSVRCEIYSGIECFGNRTFYLDSVPCVKYSSHDFICTLFYSIFLGLFAVDRFYLGHIGIAVGKLITLGGLGLWWIIDIILLIFGKLMPQDQSNWIVQH